MPWKLQPSEGGYYVVDDKGKKYSKKPMSKSRALRQMRALYASEGTKETMKEAHTGVMVAWKVPQAMAEMLRAIASKAGIPENLIEQPEDIHMTIAYFGDALLQTVTQGKASETLGNFAKKSHLIYGIINGFAVFEVTHLPDMRALVALVDVPALPEFRQEIVKAMGSIGMSTPRTHGFTAHITIAYIPKELEIGRMSIPPVDVNIDEIRLYWGDVVTAFSLKPNTSTEIKEHSSGLSVYKESGEWRWVLRSSTAYRDRDGEIVSIKALQDDCDRADSDGNYGPLRWWHVPGLDIGDCDFNMVYGKTLVESGTFRSPEIAHAVAKEAKRLHVSIGFNHPRNQPDENGVFSKIKRFERSLLPMGRASNPFTAVPAVRKEHEDMASVQEKIKAFAALIKDDSVVESILKSVEASEKSADAAGAEFKEADEAEKAKKVEVEVEDEGDEEMGMEDETEEEKGFEDEGPFVGDLTPDEFGSLMATALSKTVDPIMQSIKELQGEQEATKEARTKEVDVLSRKIVALEKRLKELEGGTPKAAKGYVASEADDNLVDENHRLKNAAPTADPQAGFFDFALGNN